MTAFEHIFRLQCFLELFEKYGQLILNKGIHGCYLQTELGHGTNVGRLETTATYLSDTPEFEIHSPTLSSTKWWTGALGKTDTHGVVQAMLILPGGKDMGPHLFFVQLRDVDTHKVLPGLMIGDIGPKVMGGFAAVDNGFACFDREYRPDGPPKMIYIRSGCVVSLSSGTGRKLTSMITTAGWSIGRAATIAIRYATVWRLGQDGLERQVISYPSLNVRLVPVVARAYVFIQLGRFLTLGFDSLTKGLSSGDMSQLAEMHVMTSGLKVYLLFLLTTVGSGLVDMLSYGIFRAVPTGNAIHSRDPTRELRLAIAVLCGTTLLPEIIGLTDAFGFTDWELDSALGVFDGRAYEALWKRVQDEPLNQTEVTEAYEESIKPILLRGQRLVAAGNKSKL
ncbi:acyl-CoA dehydrogenase/oxidase [Mycena amicta]|nr:acyl-CoA dehydrogenase/oxidase [Mycena amicta]